MPALLTSTSIDLKRDSAVSTILAAVAGSPMWPSTRATWSEAVSSVDWVTFRELATTLKPRSTNPFTIPAPIPCEAPVTMAVFGGPLMVVCLENVGNSRLDTTPARGRRQYCAARTAGRPPADASAMHLRSHSVAAETATSPRRGHPDTPRRRSDGCGNHRARPVANQVVHRRPQRPHPAV